MANPWSWSRFLALSLLSFMTTPSSGAQGVRRQGPTGITPNCTALKDAYHNITIIQPTGNPFLGHQNFSYGCARAVMTYLDNNCQDTAEIRIFGLTSDSQWPCDEKWAQNPAGSPLVQASWAWVSRVCPGWQLPAAGNTTQWLQLLVGFLLPAVIYSINIPRRSKFKVWNGLFPKDISGFRLLGALLGAVVAVFIVVIDNVFWLLTVFATAAPCLISGIYEGWLDKKVLAFLDTGHTSDKLPLALRARMLFTILTGNLDLYPAWSDTMVLASSLDELDEWSYVVTKSQDTKESDHPHPDDASDENRTKMSIRKSLEEKSVDANSPPELDSSQINATHVGDEKEIEFSSAVAIDHDRRRKVVGKVSSRLNAMLACQYGFGCTIGGPVLYYIGSFIYAIVEISQNYGDRDLSHALAFGMWFMVIPHCAIVSGSLLGGNNPNTLEGIVGAKEEQYSVSSDSIAKTMLRRKSTYHEYHELEHVRQPYHYFFDRVYEAAYIPASMWNRGQCMQKWLIIHCVSSLLRYKDDRHFHQMVRLSMHQFLDTTAMFNFLAWIYLVMAAFSLVFVPCLLGFLVSYFTPQVGLSCRSLCYTLFISAQSLLLILWTVQMTFGDRYWLQMRLVKQYIADPQQSDKLWQAVQTLADLANRDTSHPTETSLLPFATLKRRLPDVEGSDRGSASTHEWPVAAKYLYQFLLLLGFAVSVFASVGGVLMELLGVFRSNVCNVNVPQWRLGHRVTSWITLSVNSAEAIRLAKAMWTVLGAVSLVFLLVTCYIGWWYQRRLRVHFRGVARRLDQSISSS